MRCDYGICTGGKCRVCRNRRYEVSRMIENGQWQIRQDAGGFIARERGGNLLVSVRESADVVYTALLNADFVQRKHKRASVCALPCKVG